jgi:small conductance mechanosensitive channel
MSKDYARALVDVEVSSEQDVDQVVALLKELGQELAKDMPESVAEVTDVKGVESFTTPGYIVRTLTKTVPGMQWDVAREMRRRILIRFRAEGIKQPSPGPLWK